MACYYKKGGDKMVLSELVDKRASIKQRIAECEEDLYDTENEIKKYLIDHQMFSYLSVNYGRLFRHDNPRTKVPKYYK